VTQDDLSLAVYDNLREADWLGMSPT